MEATLDQLGAVLVQASKSVPKEKRGTFEDVMRLLKIPVGKIGRNK